MAEKWRLQYKSHFDAAHQLVDYVGKCNRLHGHRWDVEIVIEGDQLDGKQMLLDFTIVKKTLNDILEDLDHRFLNDVLFVKNPTAEFLSKYIYTRFSIQLEELKKSNPEIPPMAKLSRVCIWESPEACVKYYTT